MLLLNKVSRIGRVSHPQGVFTHYGGLADVSNCFEFKDYEPHTFRRIRQLSGVTDEVYTSAVFQVNYLPSHTPVCTFVCIRSGAQTDKEKYNLGKSNAFLYFSNDSRFIVKTTEEVGVPPPCMPRTRLMRFYHAPG